MNNNYDVYMCRAKFVFNATNMRTESRPYKLICKNCGADRTYENNHRCMVIDPVRMTATPYVDVTSFAKANKAWADAPKAKKAKASTDYPAAFVVIFMIVSTVWFFW